MAARKKDKIVKKTLRELHEQLSGIFNKFSMEKIRQAFPENRKQELEDYLNSREESISLVKGQGVVAVMFTSLAGAGVYEQAWQHPAGVIVLGLAFLIGTGFAAGAVYFRNRKNETENLLRSELEQAGEKAAEPEQVPAPA